MLGTHHRVDCKDYYLARGSRDLRVTSERERGEGGRAGGREKARRGPVSEGSKLLRPFSEDTFSVYLPLLPPRILTSVLVRGICVRGIERVRSVCFLILFSKAKAEGPKAGII